MSGLGPVASPMTSSTKKKASARADFIVYTKRRDKDFLFLAQPPSWKCFQEAQRLLC